MSLDDAAQELPGTLDVRSQAEALESAHEFLRMWKAADGGGVLCFINPAKLGADPALFGIALVDCMRHGAKAWARATGVDEEQVAARILEGFDAERGSPTDIPLPLTPEGDTH